MQAQAIVQMFFVLRNYFSLFQDAAPLRMKGGHIVNCPAAFEKLINVMKSLLNEKNRNRVSTTFQIEVSIDTYL